MSRRTTPAALLVLFAFVASLACRKAAAVPEDPIVREAEDLFVSYLKIDTTNPPGNETRGAQLLQQYLAKNGIESRLVGSDPQRQALYARLASGTNEKALILLHHIDVVPAVASEWTKPPFSGMRSGGYIWGRGALDIKSLGIAELVALVDLKRRGTPLKRDVIYLAVPDEELGGLKGCKELLEKHPELFANAGFVLNEGGFNETVVDKVRFWGIEIQQKVPLWLRIDAAGEAGHAASPPDSGGASGQLVRALGAIQQIETPYRLSPSVQKFFTNSARVRTDPRGRILQKIGEPLDAAMLRELPQGYRNLLRDTIAITRISAGMSVNVVPSHASADLDIRLLPDANPQVMLDRVRTAVGKSAKVEVVLAGEAVPESPADTELFRVLDQAFRKAEPDSSVGPVVGLGTTDSRWFRARGIVAYGISPFKVNYYDASAVHGNDEKIRARFFGEGVKVMREVVRTFCAR